MNLVPMDRTSTGKRFDYWSTRILLLKRKKGSYMMPKATPFGSNHLSITSHARKIGLQIFSLHSDISYMYQVLHLLYKTRVHIMI
jgi:hypothetical protein